MHHRTSGALRNFKYLLEQWNPAFMTQLPTQRCLIHACLDQHLIYFLVPVKVYVLGAFCSSFNLIYQGFLPPQYFNLDE